MVYNLIRKSSQTVSILSQVNIVHNPLPLLEDPF
jgi:hypothetical protein